MKYITLIACLIMPSCSFNLLSLEGDSTAKDSFPMSPPYAEYKSPPVIRKDGDNFVVTPEMVKRAIQQKEFLDSVEAWKNAHGVK